MPSFDITLAFFGAALFLGIAPGPDNIFVLTQSALYGMRAGLATTCGLACGLCVHTVAVALGIAVIFQTSPLAFNLLRLVGAGYLCWLAWLSLKAGAATTGQTKSMAFPGYATLCRRGIIMNVSNPKVALFFLAFLPQFCNPATGSVTVQIIYFGALFILATIIVFFTVSALGGRLADWFNSSPRGQIIMHRCAAIIFIGMAAALLFMDSGMEA